MKKVNRKKGFTLIELIVVIAILGILAAIAIPRFAGTQQRARQNADNASVRVIQGAVRMFEAENGTLPHSDTAANFLADIGDYLSGGALPTNQVTGNHFYYNSNGTVATGSVAPASPATGWLTLN